MKNIILFLFCVVSVSGLASGTADKCSNCLPRAHLRVYERRSCQPIMSPECNCPLYYDCPPEVVIQPLPEVEKLKLKLLGENACIFEDKVFAIGESLKIPCKPCSCELTGNGWTVPLGSIKRKVSGHVIKGAAYGRCIHNDCWSNDDELGPGCHFDYSSKGCSQCTPNQICPGHEKVDFRCKVGEKTYRYGEKIEGMRKDPCKICLCDEKFDENNLEQSTCWQERCYPTRTNHHPNREGIDESGLLMQHCTPVYFRTYCCHWDFICDKDFKPEAVVFKARPTTVTDTCVLRDKSYKLGEKVDFKPEDTYLNRFGGENGTCTCRVPPLMNCYYERD